MNKLVPKTFDDFLKNWLQLVYSGDEMISCSGIAPFSSECDKAIDILNPAPEKSKRLKELMGNGASSYLQKIYSFRKSGAQNENAIPKDFFMVASECHAEYLELCELLNEAKLGISEEE